MKMMRAAPTAARVARHVARPAHARCLSSAGENVYSAEKRVPVNPMSAFSRRMCWPCGGSACVYRRGSRLTDVLHAGCDAFLLWRVFVMCVWAWPVMDRISGTFLLEDMTRGTWIALEGA